MRITVGIDDKIIEKLISLTNAKNKTKAINIAIEDFLKRKRKNNLLQLRGRLHLESDWKKLREGEISEK